MRWISLVLGAIILMLQYPLWMGKGSWLKVRDVGQQVEAQKQINKQTQIRNAILDAEVRDLKQGTEAIEERARYELGMVKSNEVFFQIIGNRSLPAALSVSSVTAVNPKKNW